MSTKSVPDLRTKYVFIDTQSYRKQQFNWNGATFSRLVEHAKQGHVQILITDITKGEVRERLKEMLEEATTAAHKFGSILDQVSGHAVTGKFLDAPAALEAISAAFDAYLTESKTSVIPIDADLNAVFGDYFGRRPPFSTKKKSEFPDAIVVASLKAWCARKKETVYVVSEDPDLVSCCMPEGPLFHSPSIGDIVSRATVSRETRLALEAALEDNAYLNEMVAEQIKDTSVDTRWLTRSVDEVEDISGRVERVDSVNLVTINVLEQKGLKFSCELEYEAEIVVGLSVRVAGRYVGYEDDWEPPFTREVETAVTKYVTAYAEVIFDKDQPTEIEFEEVSIGGWELELDRGTVSRSELGFRW